jgi:ribosomal peptide maturation radical SAM protein 1
MQEQKLSERKRDMFTDRIALISLPWPIFNRPSIQLGTLKAYVKKQIPELEIAAHHFYLKLAESIGYDVYKVLSERSWIAESVYAALLYPENFGAIEKVFYKQFSGKSKIKKLKFDQLVKKTEDISLKFVSENRWSDFGLIGFSVCLCQLTSSLYFIREIKIRYPEIVLVAGGSLIAVSSARSMLEHFPHIDAIIVGEGEIPLVSLVKHLRENNSLMNLPLIDGVVVRQFSEKPVCFSQISSLVEIPEPDYQEYFETLKRFDPEKKFFPALPVEISRGCSWRSKKSYEGENGCAFCNLNLQWKGYRTKETDQVVSEIDSMTSRYEVLSIVFMDNVIPEKKIMPVFKTLSLLKKDFYLFCELRASVNEHELRILKQAGLDEVQVGIEALSTRLLKKMNKGTTAIKNIEIMKHCEMLSVKNVSNLIIGFPGSDEKDVAQTLEAIAFLQPFRPLKIVPFWLGLASPVYQNFKAFSLKQVFNHPNYRLLFPKKISDNVQFLIQDYKGGKAGRQKLWRPVIDAVSAWKKTYEKLHEKPGSSPVLSFRDGKDFMIIRERLINGDPKNHRLRGQSRAIYLFCHHARSIDKIVKEFPDLKREKLIQFLKMMVLKKLMFEENGKFLSLAVPERLHASG